MGIKYLQDGKTDEELMSMGKIAWRRYLLNRVRRLEIIVAAGIIANFMDLKLDAILEILAGLL